MADKIEKKRKFSIGLSYFVNSSYFIMNTLALLSYPICRNLGLKQKAKTDLEDPILGNDREL